MFDLRSDTVTKPTPAMLHFMMQAVVGDDVFGEDPTVAQLENTVATLLGKAAGVFVPSGCMGNQIALKCHTQPGNEVLLEEGSHIYQYEAGMGSAFSGVQLRPIVGENGILEAHQIQKRPPYHWEAQSTLLCLENTHNKAGGTIYPLHTLIETTQKAKNLGLKCHLDGARLWNASVATGIAEADYAAPFDSVNVCLSKGLGAPVGSVLCGDRAFIDQARRYRKMMGGAMRQSGILAAAGLYALEHHRADLAEDHQKAQILSDKLAQIEGLSPRNPQTNILMIDTKKAATDWLPTFEKWGLKVTVFGANTLRAVTHRDIDLESLAKWQMA